MARFKYDTFAVELIFPNLFLEHFSQLLCDLKWNNYPVFSWYVYVCEMITHVQRETYKCYKEKVKL